MVKKLLLASISLCFILFVSEKISDRFKDNAQHIIVREETTNATTSATVPDPDLIWKFNPGSEFNGRTVNQLGFLDREVDPIKKSGTIRVICMGDSCTGQGPPPYSGYLHEMLTNAPPSTNTWEAFNMGVHGYSSVQGLRLFQLRGKALQPDIVTIYYGWNDHWLDESDRVRMGLAQKTFLLQLAQRLRLKSAFRVTPEEYENTLTQFIQEIRSVNAAPILITAPRRRLTGHHVKSGRALSIEQAERAHDQYVEITRRVAHEQKTELLDLAQILSNEKYRKLFSSDGIHFRHAGLEKIAELLYQKIKDTADHLKPPT